MNPEMTTPLGDLLGVAVFANFALAWVALGGLRRIRTRLAKRAGKGQR